MCVCLSLRESRCRVVSSSASYIQSLFNNACRTVESSRYRLTQTQAPSWQRSSDVSYKANKEMSFSITYTHVVMLMLAIGLFK